MPAAKPPEFRRRAVELARRREKSIAEIAHDLGIAESCLRRWLKQDDIDAGRAEGLSTDERAELVRLRRENRELRRANAILKSASVNSTGQRNTFTILEVCGGEAGPAGHERRVSRAVMGDVGCRKVDQRDLEGDRLSARFDLHGDQTNRRLRSGAA